MVLYSKFGVTKIFRIQTIGGICAFANVANKQ